MKFQFENLTQQSESNCLMLVTRDFLGVSFNVVVWEFLAKSVDLPYWINFYKSFIMWGLSQIAVGYFWKMAWPIFLKFACRFTFMTSNYRELGRSKSDEAYFFNCQNSKFFMLHQDTWQATWLTPYMPRVVAMTWKFAVYFSYLIVWSVLCF